MPFLQPLQRRVFPHVTDGGVTAADILEQCRKLDEAGIEYYFVYMTGLAGKGRGYWNAVNSAKLFSQLNPYFISVDSLTLFPDTELYRLAGEPSLYQMKDQKLILQRFSRNGYYTEMSVHGINKNFIPVFADIYDIPI